MMLHRQLRETVNVGLARAVVAALDGVVEQAVDGVAVVLVVLRGVDPALRGDAVGAARAVVDAEAVDVVAELGKRGGGRRPGEARAHDDDRVLALVRGVDELDLEPMAVPLLGQRSGGHLRIERHDRPPKNNTHSGMDMNPTARTTANVHPILRITGVNRGVSAPIV